MKIIISELIILQTKAAAVMFGAGILVESLWRLKNNAKGRLCREKSAKPVKDKAGRILIESAFWIICTVIICEFLYYAGFGRITLYSVAGFFAGLLLWKKICCVIIK